MLLSEIADDYYKAAELLKNKIADLCEQEETATTTYQISRLRETRCEMLHTARLCEHYYERSFWHGDYGTKIDTSKRPKRRIPEMDAIPSRNERRCARPDEKKFSKGDSNGINADAATDITNAILQRNEAVRNCKRNRNMRAGGKQTFSPRGAQIKRSSEI